ncbi:hypothetical protein BFW38_13755 [Terasakiispira papahanaumokuakeensis]|uniref:Fe/B12 periplasmic-binding domain-containing protein n=1 Tax=Terasakiispira papahanaumokuakeensis TaxID=197479 RepID=A0A1E2VBR0_9GAMM|nr:iron-siderophore ABC transporter substrate-binding protein [Terasakiispira papahanaumokuakeensis]ODC04438.1 hypothetical protein BFW38_13755 [Terasakiispira papahanaumokuakeensis]
MGILFLAAWGRSLEAAPAQTAAFPRIVTLFQGATDSALALGVVPVGSVVAWENPPLYPYWGDRIEALKGAPPVHWLGLETQPNLEEIAWLQPDHIIATSFRHTQIMGLLGDIAPVQSVADVYDFKATLQAVARATGQQKKAQHMLCQWDHQVADLRAQLKRTLGDAWPPRVAVVNIRQDHVRLYYHGFAGAILDEVGFRRPAADEGERWGIKLTSREAIPALEADVIFLFMDKQNPQVRQTYQRWREHPLWQQLTAVRRQAVWPVDRVAWSLGGGWLAAEQVMTDLYRLYGLDQPAFEACPYAVEGSVHEAH